MKALVSVACAASLLLSGVALSHAAYPEKPIRIVVSFAAGGGSDILMRMLARVIEQEKLLPVRMTIVNVDGAAGTLGARQVKDAEPDGYTYLMSHFALLGAAATGVADFSVEAFEPVAQVATSCLIWAAMDDFRHDTLKPLLDEAKANPNSIREAVNIGAVTHITSWMTTDAYGGAKLRYVQSGGGAKRFEYLYGGHVDVTQFSTAEYTAFSPKGLKGLAFLGPERHPSYPDIPTAKEQGIDVTACVSDWFLAPKGTPPEVTGVFADAIKRALQTPAMKEFFERDLRDPNFLEGEALREQIEAEAELVRTVVARHKDELAIAPKQ